MDYNTECRSRDPRLVELKRLTPPMRTDKCRLHPVFSWFFIHTPNDPTFYMRRYRGTHCRQDRGGGLLLVNGDDLTFT